MINNLPPDRYEISGIRAISAANTGRGRPHVSAETTEFDRPIPFEIHANEVTLLNYQLYIEQKFLSPSVINRYSQGHSLRPLDEIQQKQIIGELQSLENNDLWNMSQLSATKLPSPEDGIISTNELQLDLNEGWGRR